MQGFTYIDLAVLIVYLLAVLIAGLYFAKKEMKGKEYFKGDGTVPWWVTSVSIFATLLRFRHRHHPHADALQERRGARLHCRARLQGGH